MGKLGSELSHGIAMLHVLAGKVIQLVEVLRIAADDYAAVAVFHCDHSLVHNPCAVLDELAE